MGFLIGLESGLFIVLRMRCTNVIAADQTRGQTITADIIPVLEIELSSFDVHTQ